MKLLLIFVSLLIIASCSKNTDYLVFEEPRPEPIPPVAIEEDVRRFKLDRFLKDSNKIDILFVIDNSGSMSSIQENVASNAEVFMRQFALNSLLDWKIGIVSTDSTEAPYLGFKTPFSSKLVDIADPLTFDRVVSTFASTVRSLGTNGSASEYVFYNAIRAFDEWNGTITPTFLRSGAHLAVIMITDEPEQSLNQYGSLYTVNNMLNNLTMRLASRSILRFYGAFKLKGLADCTSYDDFQGSPYDEIIEATAGLAISACINDFGIQLARIGEDILTFAKTPRIALKNRPVIDSIELIYRGEPLKPGRPEDGGIWYYDYETNTINFYTIDFIEDIENDELIIDFDVDDGIDRE